MENIDYCLDLNKCQIAFMSFLNDENASNFMVECSTKEGQMLMRQMRDYFYKIKYESKVEKEI